MSFSVNNNIMTRTYEKNGVIANQIPTMFLMVI